MKEAPNKIVESAINAEALSRAILEHYCKTISELTGKSEMEIKNEVLEITNKQFEKVKERINPQSK